MIYLVNVLKVYGYESGKLLYGVLYDFWFVLGLYVFNVVLEYLKDLKDFIEIVYLVNVNELVVIFVYSMGGLWIFFFLN